MIGGVLLAYVVLMGAGFAGGILYQKNTGSAAVGSAPVFQGTPPAGAAEAAATGGRVVGEVKSIVGNTLTLSTAQDVTTVTLTESTRITRRGLGSITDLKVGDQMQVIGQSDARGVISADQVTDLGPQGSAGFASTAP
jgi:hypothetical protein